MKVTEKDFIAYLRVQKQGRFNMLSREARVLTGLDEGKYRQIINSYSQLMKEFEGAYNKIMGGGLK